MSGAPSLELNLSLTKLRQHARYTIQRLQIRSWGSAWVALFEAEVKNMDTALATETRLADAVYDAEAGVHIADATLDGLAHATNSTAKMVYYGANYREVKENLFGMDTPTEFTRPLLQDQLEDMRDWPGYLGGLSNATMKALGPKVDTAIKAADTAVDAMNKADGELANFRSSVQAGLIKKINGMFQGLLGEARKQAQETGKKAEAEGLFLATEQRRRRRAPALTLDRAAATVTALEQDLAEARQDLDQLKAAATAAAEAAAKRRARQEQMEALLKRRGETDAEIDKLRDEMHKDGDK